MRVESGVFEGGQVSTHYDAMIAKLITHCDGDGVRADNLRLMHSCLEQFEVSGLQTNIEFLKRVLKHEAFMDGGVTTDFIPNHERDLFYVEVEAVRVRRASALASLGYLLYFNLSSNQKLVGYTTNGGMARGQGQRVKLYDVKDGEIAYNSFIKRTESDSWLIGMGGDEEDEEMVVQDVVLSKDGKRMAVKLEDESIECNLCFHDNKVSIFHDGGRYDFVHTAPVQLKYAPEFVKGKGGIVIAPEPDEDSPVILHRSPMQAKVYELVVTVGERVTKGQLMGSVESMKQLYEVWAECDGTITDIVVSAEESVIEGQPLIKVERAATGTQMKPN